MSRGPFASQVRVHHRVDPKGVLWGVFIMGIQCQPALQPEEGLLLRTRGLQHLLSLQPGLDSPCARTLQTLTSALVPPPICWSGCGYHPILWIRKLSCRAGNSLQAAGTSPAQSLGGRAALWLHRCVFQCPALTITTVCSGGHIPQPCGGGFLHPRRLRKCCDGVWEGINKRVHGW